MFSPVSNIRLLQAKNFRARMYTGVMDQHRVTDFPLPEPIPLRRQSKVALTLAVQR
jgi:hypothetical protein